MGSLNIGREQLRNGIVPTRSSLRSVSSVETIADRNGGLTQGFISQVNCLLKRLPTSLIKKLQPHMRKAAFSDGEFLYRPDEEIEWIYFPETTAISELQILEDGRTIEISLTGREGAIGLPAIYWPSRAANWVQTCAPGVAIRINREMLRKETRNLDWVNSLFHENIQLYIRQISQKVACNAHHSVEERFSTWLLMLQDRCPAGRLKLTQEHIARVLGVYRPSVTCIAQELRELGLIDYIRGNIVILDREELKKRSCGCYSDLGVTGAGYQVIGGFNEQSKPYVV